MLTIRIEGFKITFLYCWEMYQGWDKKPPHSSTITANLPTETNQLEHEGVIVSSHS